MNTNFLSSLLFRSFTLLVIVINAGLTAVFGFTYLAGAFGDSSGLLAPYLAAGYAVLILDAGYVTWFRVYLTGAESTAQRGISLTMAVVCLIGSTAATITQLAINSASLVDLSAYYPTIGITALVMVMAVTVGHVLSIAGYVLAEPGQLVKTRAAGLRSAMLDKALDQLQQRIETGDQGQIVDAMAADFRRDILANMGFSGDLKRMTQADQAQPVAAQISGSNDPRVVDTHREKESFLPPMPAGPNGHP